MKTRTIRTDRVMFLILITASILERAIYMLKVALDNEVLIINGEWLITPTIILIFMIYEIIKTEREITKWKKTQM